MVQNIAKDVYQIPLMPRNSINCYIIEGILIDSGIRNSYKKIKQVISEIPIHAHALTHAHADHQGSSDTICNEFNIPLICHGKEVTRTETGLVTTDYPSNTNLIARFQQKYWAGQGHKVNKTVQEHDKIENFVVIETPGHSSGHISFFRENDGLLIIGDVATNMNLLTTVRGLHLPPNIFTTNQQENIESLKKLSVLQPKIICFGHGSVLLNRNKEFENFVNKF